MDLTPELLGAGAVGVVVILGAIGNYLNGKRNAHKIDPVMSGVGGGFVDTDLMRQLVVEVRRIADAITDKNTAGLNQRLDEITDAIDHLKDPDRRPRR